MSSEEVLPLILCMENIRGEEVVLRIEPTDDFNSFLTKTKTLLGFDVDLASVTQSQPVKLTDNVYNFLIQNEKTLSTDTVELTTQALEQILEPNINGDDLVYVLDDGTQINATQITFDNEDIPINFNIDQIPFVKIDLEGTDSEPDDVLPNDNIKSINIIESPVSKWSSKSNTYSPHKRNSFANTLPFRSLTNNDKKIANGYEEQFTKFVGAKNRPKKTFTTLNPVKSKNKSPRSLIKDNYKNYSVTDNVDVPNQVAETPNKTAVDNIKVFSREDVLNMLKDKPVTTSNVVPNNALEKRPKHIRKTDPSKPVYKKQDHKKNSNPYISLDGTLIGNNDIKNCFICARYVTGNMEKLYIFDYEDQRLHRSSPLRRHVTTQLKIICTDCLCCYFMSSNTKSSNQDLTPNEYLVIRNNQQYIFQKVKDFTPILLPQPVKKIQKKVKSNIIRNYNRQRARFVNHFQNIKIEGSSSDVEVIDGAIDSVIDIEDHMIENLDEADEDVKAFLGKYQKIEILELKCRFCGKYFSGLSEVIDHGTEHRQVVDDEEVYPCPLCDYGYANLKWLKGHLKAAHENVDAIANKTKGVDKLIDSSEGKNDSSKDRLSIGCDNQDRFSEEDEIEIIVSSKSPSPVLKRTTSPVARRTRSSLKRKGDSHSLDIPDKESSILDDKIEISDLNVVASTTETESHVIRTEVVKQECVSDSEALWSAHTGCSDLDDVDKIPPKKRSKAPPDQSGEPKHNIVTCDNCNQNFNSKVRLKFHMQFHSKTNSKNEAGQYACYKCEGQHFTTESALFDHVHFAHGKQRNWRCNVLGCTKTFYLKATLSKHMRAHTDTRRYVCAACGKRFLDKQTLDEHSVTHLQRKPFTCWVCRKQLTRRSRLRMHLRGHEARRCATLPACAACQRTFATTQLAEEHGRKSSDCLYTIANELAQESEVASLSPTTGALVKVTSPSTIYLRKPIKLQASGPEAEAMLSLVADDVRALIRPVRIDKAFRCEYCEDTFYLEEGLNAHRAVHKGVKNPFCCHICKVSFTTYSRCTTHKTTHGLYKRPLSTAALASPVPDATSYQNDFPVVKHFLCEDCGRSYLHWTYLQVHRRMKHAKNNQSLQCQQCSLTFPNSWSINYHKKKVHGEVSNKTDAAGKPSSKQDYKIQCRDCEECVPNKTALYKHRKDKHSDPTLTYDSSPEDLFRCGECDKMYASKKGLEIHMLIHMRRRLGTSHINSQTNQPKIECNNKLNKNTITNYFNENYNKESGTMDCETSSKIMSRISNLKCLRPRISRDTLQNTIVIEMKGFDPTAQQIIDEFTKHKIKTKNIIDIHKVSFQKGETGVIPRSKKAVSTLSGNMKRVADLCDGIAGTFVKHVKVPDLTTRVQVPKVETRLNSAKEQNRRGIDNMATEDLSCITATQLLGSDAVTNTHNAELDFDESLLI